MKRWICTGLFIIICMVFSSCKNNNLTNYKISIEPDHSKNSNTDSNLLKIPPNSSFDIQFSEVIEVSSFKAEIIDLDLFETSEQIIEQLHLQNKIVICYFSAGSLEEWREDAGNFPSEIIGKNYAGWPGEKWLDIRRIDLLSPILTSRFDLCQQKGFDGVETDNVDGYQNNTGFRITNAEQITFNLWLAEQAHIRGLSIGLKNDPDQLTDLVSGFDWLLLEDCYSQGWCQLARTFIEKNKPVFAIEYTDQDVDFDAACASAEKIGFKLIEKNRNLDSYTRTCE